jgi:hypothetical protein
VTDAPVPRSTEEVRDALAGLRARRGDLLPHHGLMAVADPALLAACDATCTALTLAAWGAGAARFSFAGAHWGRHLAGYDPEAAYRRGLDALLALHPVFPRPIAEMALAAAHPCRCRRRGGGLRAGGKAGRGPGQARAAGRGGRAGARPAGRRADGHRDPAARAAAQLGLPDATGAGLRGTRLGRTAGPGAGRVYRHQRHGPCLGLPSDYDGWAQRGMPGWSRERVRPLFLRSERFRR